MFECLIVHLLRLLFVVNVLLCKNHVILCEMRECRDASKLDLVMQIFNHFTGIFFTQDNVQISPAVWCSDRLWRYTISLNVMYVVYSDEVCIY